MPDSFDTLVDRRGTDSLKYDFAAKLGKPDDVLPLWVADMDFRSPPEVLSALAERSAAGVFGYSDAANADYFTALAAWYQTRFGWTISPDWLIKTPGVVFAVSTAIRALTSEDDAVLIQPPVYYPFARSIRINRRRPIENELVLADGRYGVDLVDFERKIVQNQVKLFILCSPHNPVGRVWTEDELAAMGDLCVKHGVLVVSDEIHGDFVFPGHRHRVFANVKPAFAALSVTCTAPSKTFNLAGLQISNILIPDADLRGKFHEEINRTGYSLPNLMGLAACRAAYTHGAAWLDELKRYLTENLRFIREFLARETPKIRLIEPDGTYLLWLDCRALGMTDRALDDWILHGAKLWLDAGPMFGAGGEGFQRINIACPRPTLECAMRRLKAAYDALKP